MRGITEVLDVLYRRRLENDLRTWRERGWVSEESATAILDTVKVDGRPRTAIVLGFLGAVLIAFAAIAFVAANWVDMSRPLRLAMLVGGMALCYLIAIFLDRARHPWFADAAIFAGAALFGASIMLVAQSYHISGDYPDALLMWGAGAFLAAVLGPSRAAMVLALGIFALWAWYEVTDFGWTVHWPSLIALAAVAAVVGTWGWRPGIHLVVLALVGWIGLSIASLADSLDWSAAAAANLACASALFLFASGRFLRRRAGWSRGARFAPVLATYGLFFFLALLIVLQFSINEGSTPDFTDERTALVAAAVLAVGGAALLAGATTTLRTVLLDASPPIAISALAVGLTIAASGSPTFADSLVLQILLGILVLLAAIWAVAHGNRNNVRAAAVFGLIAFAAEVLYLYFVTFGTLLDTALFFLIGGILLIALAGLLVRLQRRFSLHPAQEPA